MDSFQSENIDSSYFCDISWGLEDDSTFLSPSRDTSPALEDSPNFDFDSACLDSPDFVLTDQFVGDENEDITAYTQSQEVPMGDYDEHDGTDGDEDSNDDNDDFGSTAAGNIENVVLSFLDQVLAGISSSPCTSAPSHASGSDDDHPRAQTTKPPKIEISVANRAVSTSKCDSSEIVTRKLVFPKRVASGSARPFAQLFRVMDLAHEAIICGVPATKRDIYYKDVELFKTQKVVDMLVDDLAATFQLERSDLNIRSSSKGLFCGPLSIFLSSGDRIEGSNVEASLIPAGEDIESFSVDESVNWVLVVEKEAVFQTLCHLGLVNRSEMPGQGILITGKGYPDVASRYLVKCLADSLPKSVPILGLMDADPYGLDILSVYKYGSQSMRHENEKLAARRVKWLGVWASDFHRYGILRDLLLPISKRDEAKALSILLRRDLPLPNRWKQELQYMLYSRRKAEIEILCSARVEPTIEASLAGEPEVQADPHALLLRYLVDKVTGASAAARERWSILTD